MSKDKKVISLEERRQGSRQRPQVDEAGGAAAGASLTGRLIWLHCPTCNTLEYTELAMAGGRVHNVCGTQVEEATVELDLEAEYTIAHINLERLTILEELLAGQRKRYEEYRKRLALAAGRALEGYPLEEESLKKLPVAEVDAFGLLISRFFHDSARHFDAGKPAEEPAAPSSQPSDD
jgi:hypothetical protein